jgi:hypothetical protein
VRAPDHRPPGTPGAGVGLALAQKLARHCDPKLTAGIYSRFGFDQDAAAIAKLPSLVRAAERSGRTDQGLVRHGAKVDGMPP